MIPSEINYFLAFLSWLTSTPEDDIEADIREIKLKYGHEDPKFLCNHLHSKQSSNFLIIVNFPDL